MSNNEQDTLKRSIYDVFAASQETLTEAKDKHKSEQSASVERMRFDKEGTFPIRILPLAPVFDDEGNMLPMDRKGYEYPIKEQLLKVVVGKDDKGADKVKYQSVCHIKNIFPDLKTDLIDLYVNLACEMYSSNAKLCDKLRSNSYSGGLKYDRKRYCYVLDLSDRAKGIKLLGLSYSQYKDLEERKLVLWSKLQQKNPKAMCPICSVNGAYPVEVTRKKEGPKTEYAINIDVVSGTDELSETELNALFEAPRLPEVLYKYRRVHLEATVEYLKQIDEKYGINVMDCKEIKECVEQISLRLPSDDQTHWTGGDRDKDDDEPSAQTIEELWDAYDALEAAGIDDRSEDGQSLRVEIREYIDAHNLDIRVSRKKSNLDLLQEIDSLEGSKRNREDEDDEDDSMPAEAALEEQDTDEPEDAEEDAPAPEPEEDEDDEEESATPSRRRSRNDDTNEPAARSDRRAGRPMRRR